MILLAPRRSTAAHERLWGKGLSGLALCLPGCRQEPRLGLAVQRGLIALVEPRRLLSEELQGRSVAAF